MDHDIIVPTTADGALVVTIVSWLKNEGDRAAQGDDLAEAATEKITLYITAPTDGTLTEIRVPAGGQANVGDVIGVLRSGGD